MIRSASPRSMPLRTMASARYVCGMGIASDCRSSTSHDRRGTARGKPVSIDYVSLDTAPASDARIPGDVVLEPAERVLVATKPLALWLPIAIGVFALWLVVLYSWSTGSTGVFGALAVLAVAV